MHGPKITGIFQGDLIIKTAIELAIGDLRKEPWIIEDMFRSLIENPYLATKYGMKEIDRAKEFILNNNIPVYLRHRVDKQDFPCITISVGSSQEDKSLATLGDLSPYVEEYAASDIGTPIKYIVKPFDPVSYDPSTGIVEVPENTDGYLYVRAGMVAVEPETGNGYIIEGKAGTNGFKIIANAPITGKIGVIPEFQIYRARRERTISQENYNIGCHVQGDPSTLIFLHSLVKYALYRYREGLLEAVNFQLSNLSSTDLIRNEAFNIENVYSRWVTLTGQCEESWVKTPFRVIESVELTDSSDDLIPQGIRILSNSEPPNQSAHDIWIAIDEDEENT